MTEQVDGLDGLVTFYASHHAVRAEKTLSRDGYQVPVGTGTERNQSKLRRGYAIRVPVRRCRTRSADPE